MYLALSVARTMSGMSGDSGGFCRSRQQALPVHLRPSGRSGHQRPFLPCVERFLACPQGSEACARPFLPRAQRFLACSQGSEACARGAERCTPPSQPFGTKSHRSGAELGPLPTSTCFKAPTSARAAADELPKHDEIPARLRIIDRNEGDAGMR